MNKIYKINKSITEGKNYTNKIKTNERNARKNKNDKRKGMENNKGIVTNTRKKTEIKGANISEKSETNSH